MPIEGSIIWLTAELRLCSSTVGQIAALGILANKMSIWRALYIVFLTFAAVGWLISFFTEPMSLADEFEDLLIGSIIFAGIPPVVFFSIRWIYAVLKTDGNKMSGWKRLYIVYLAIAAIGWVVSFFTEPMSLADEIEDLLIGSIIIAGIPLAVFFPIRWIYRGFSKKRP